MITVTVDASQLETYFRKLEDFILSGGFVGNLTDKIRQVRVDRLRAEIDIFGEPLLELEPSTITRKGFDDILFETGQMESDIVSVSEGVTGTVGFDSLESMNKMAYAISGVYNRFGMLKIRNVWRVSDDEVFPDDEYQMLCEAAEKSIGDIRV